MNMPMPNGKIPIIPNYTLFRIGPVDERELKTLRRLSKKKVFSLDKTQATILSTIVLPYWQNYLSSIVHSFDQAEIKSLNFAWINNNPSRDPKIVRVAQVVMETYVSINLLPEEIIFQVGLYDRNIARICVIIHEGRGKFELYFRTPI
jgi:hypothetical protein